MTPRGMRSLSLLVLVVALAAPAARANEAFFAAETVKAARVKKAPSSVDDGQWAKVEGGEVKVYPQQTIRLNDKKANESLAAQRPKSVVVKAAYDERRLSVLLEWSDETENRVHPEETSAFADTVAIETPVRFGEGIRLPYVGMGDDAEKVYVYMQRAIEDGSLGREYVAAGYGSLTRTTVGGSLISMRYDAGAKRWRALFSRPLVAGGHSLKSGLVPFALAVWDGEGNQRGGNKALSSWKFLRLEAFPTNKKYLEEMSFGYRPGDIGDPQQGKALVQTVCVACHRVADKRFALEGFAPDLSGIGGISTYGYLRDSLLLPSDVIVPSLNVNRHYKKAAPPDANGAYPNNDMYVWHTVDGSGKKVSKMTSFSSMPKDAIANMVAYLKTLGTEEP